MEEKYHLQTHPTEKAEKGAMGGCNYKKNLNNPKCFLNICNSVSFLKNMGILKVIIQTEKEQMWRKSRTGCRRQRTRQGSRHKR